MSNLYDIRSGELVTSKLFSNGFSLKEIINSNITTPSILDINEYILKGSGESAVAYAMVGLVGEDIEWVLDPANNRVEYSVAASASCTYYAEHRENRTPKFSSPSMACDALVGFPSSGGSTITSSSYTGSACYSEFRSSPTYAIYGNVAIITECSPPPEPVKKYIPIDTVAAKVISNAEAGHAPSQKAVNNSIKK